MTDPKPPADLTPAELIAELERRRDIAGAIDLDSIDDPEDCAVPAAEAAAYADALALVRPVVERLTEELAAAEATAEDEEAAHSDTIGLVCRSLAGTLGRTDVDSGHVPQWLARVREHVERLERERSDLRELAEDAIACVGGLAIVAGMNDADLEHIREQCDGRHRDYCKRLVAVTGDPDA